eukprot:TRINITY_DN5565_c0_g1_i1.p2 TRINITY_DN5565_c0_g1~~TRINITY_DN5565_c0_g1_i1.p2  ORF type:complete len:120 (+),score=5.06 TRINITY_DN5565_c0_g1_i1:48-362(+)
MLFVVCDTSLAPNPHKMVGFAIGIWTNLGVNSTPHSTLLMVRDVDVVRRIQVVHEHAKVEFFTSLNCRDRLRLENITSPRTSTALFFLNFDFWLTRKLQAHQII